MPPKRKGRQARKTKDVHEPEIQKRQKRERTKNTVEEYQENINKHKQIVEDIKITKDKKQAKIEIGKRAYTFDLKSQYVKDNKKLLEIISKFSDFESDLKEKSQAKIEDILKITDHFNFSALEYFLFHAQENIHRQEHKIKIIEEEKCCICQFELYENVNEFTDSQFIKQMKNPSDDDVVGLAECDGHFFHKECLLNCVEKKHIKCPICSRIYGEMMGDQPDGTMNHRVQNMSCSGYEDVGTIVINYHFPNGTRNGKHYSGTSRQAYLPNNKEGQECLELLKTGFKRKLLFTVGRSVTTGVDNTTVWNGVHHKTNTSGGAAYFGYPDPTYFNRLKLELAMKGVY